VKALVAVEDGTFWTHHGVRPLSVVRAACQNLFYRRRISGASTITMQAVRLIRPHPKTLWWKYKEAVMAVKMERAKDKRWILSQYLNRAPYGSNFVGIEAAASGWFGKSARQLGLAEAAMLAGMVQAPSRFRPDRDFERAMKRRDHVLRRMLETGVITQEQLEAARSVKPVVRRAPRPFRHPHFCDWYLEEMSRSGRLSGDVVTTLDADIQETLVRAVDAAAREGGWSVAAVVMRADTRAVVSLACSGDYFDAKAGQVNTALAPRPAGSTLKPFLTALALDEGVVAPGERLSDVPTAFKGYSPANFDATHRGEVTLRDALVLSLNVPFVSLLRRVGVERFGRNLRELGFAHLSAPDETFGLGMAIGNVEVTLMELVRAYATVARGGDGVYSRTACRLVTDMLAGDERSRAALGHVADVRASRFAWKTGTSSAYRDAWTVAWNPEYVVGVWCGHKSGGFGDRTLVGAKAAAPLAWTLARALYPQDDGPWYAGPVGTVPVKVCAKTGRPANPCCPSVADGVAMPARTMARTCDVHRLDANGRTVEREDPQLAAFSGRIGKAQGLAILKPEDGARFSLVRNGVEQHVVCKVAGNPDGATLWWFVDGRPAGTSVGSEPFRLEMEVGDHVVVCVTQEGVSASVVFSVQANKQTN